MTPSATMRASQKIGAPARSASRAASAAPGEKTRSRGRLHHAAGVDDPHRDPLLERREARKVGLAADDGEGPAIDRRRRPSRSRSSASRRPLGREHLRALVGEELRDLRARQAAPRGRIAGLAGQE